MQKTPPLFRGGVSFADGVKQIQNFRGMVLVEAENSQRDAVSTGIKVVKLQEIVRDTVHGGFAAKSPAFFSQKSNAFCIQRRNGNAFGFVMLYDLLFLRQNAVQFLLFALELTADVFCSAQSGVGDPDAGLDGFLFQQQIKWIGV